MTNEEVVAMTNRVFVESFELDEKDLTPEAHVFEDLGLDSLDTVDLVVALQQKFNVRIRDDERVRSIRTLNDVYEFILTIQREMAASN
ncbi:MAG: acyl carrier protein [Spartobacteria bacterium]|nr:acyl carrier protein [Spartobacteria bacterium]